MIMTKAERDEFNKKIARESSWLCKIFQQKSLDKKEKSKIISALTDAFKQKRDKVGA